MWLSECYFDTYSVENEWGHVTRSIGGSQWYRSTAVWALCQPLPLFISLGMGHAASYQLERKQWPVSDKFTNASGTHEKVPQFCNSNTKTFWWCFWFYYTLWWALDKEGCIGNSIHSHKNPQLCIRKQTLSQMINLTMLFLQGYYT